MEELTIWYPQSQPLANAYVLLSNIPFESENLAQELISEEVEYLYLQNLQSGTSVPVQMSGVQHIRVQNENNGGLSLLEVDISGHVEDCGNGIDDDCDGFVDCDDKDCGPRIVNVDIINPSCGICPDGQIFIQASGANSQYFLYSIDGGTTFQHENTFENLLPSEYEVAVKNFITGCISETIVNLYPPEGDPSECCANGGFELGDFTNWTGGVSSTYGGGFTNTTLSTSSSGLCACTFGCARHSILSGSFVDPIINKEIISASSGMYVARLGNCENGKEKERLTFNITVDECNSDLFFNYLMVMQDPDHNSDENPYFRYIITNETTGEEIEDEKILADTGNDIFEVIPNQNGDIVYTNWRCVSVDLLSEASIGDVVSIEFINSDCKLQEHYGYTYLDGLCNSQAESEPKVVFDVNEVYCSNQEILVDGTGSLDYIRYRWSICEVSSTGELVNCFFQPQYTTGLITELLNVNELYISGSFQFECEKTYVITLTLECPLPLSRNR